MANKENWENLFTSVMLAVCCGLAVVSCSNQNQNDLKPSAQGTQAHNSQSLSPAQQKQIEREDVYFQKAPAILFQGLATLNVPDLLQMDYNSIKLQIPDVNTFVNLEMYPLQQSSAFYQHLQKMKVLDDNNTALYVEITPDWGPKEKGKYIGYGKAWYVLGKQGENLFIYAVTDEYNSNTPPLEETNLNTQELFVGHYETFMKKIRVKEINFMQNIQTPNNTEKKPVPPQAPQNDKKPTPNSGTWRGAQLNTHLTTPASVKGLYSRQATRTCPRVG